MTDPHCEQVAALIPPRDRESRTDRLADLLECLADLSVEAHARRDELAGRACSDDARVQGSIAALDRLDRQLETVCAAATSVRPRLLHEHLI
jgi:hypothetical protein